MHELALFAGAGGGILGGKLLGWRTVCAVEIDPYCREVLLRRQEDGSLGPFPVWDDVRTFDGKPWRGKVDVVSAGFPCQPFSTAGKRLGEDDDRNMWPQTARILSEVRPRFALLENVPGLISTPYWGTVIGDLARLGFDAEWCITSAEDCGAPHQRKRLWILLSDTLHRAGSSKQKCEHQRPEESARGSSNGLDTIKAVADSQVQPLGSGLCEGESGGCGRGRSSDRGSQKDVADANGSGCKERRGTESVQTKISGPKHCVQVSDAGCGDGKGQGCEVRGEEVAPWWSVEPGMGRLANGVAYRVDRLKALGNGQVPAVVKRALNELIQS